MSPASPGAGGARRRTALALSAVLVAAAAGAGAMAVLTGHFGSDVDADDRLPLHRPAIRAVALVALVAVPFAVLAWQAWRGDLRTDLASLIAGEMAVAWVVVEAALVRSPELLVFAFAAAAAGSVFAGRRALSEMVRNLRSSRQRSP